MKKRMRAQALLLALALLLSLTACGGTRERDEEDEEESTSVSERRQRRDRGEETPAAEESEPAETREPDPAPTQEPAPTETPAPAVRVSAERQDGGSGERVVFSGLTADGETAWQYVANTSYRTELTLIQEIGLWRDRYYFNLAGTVTCLNLADGSLRWRNDEFGGASISALVDEDNGNVYLCGWYGPDFFACDAEGNVLTSFPNLVEGYYWAHDLTRSGVNELCFWYAGGGEEELPVYIDLTDFSATWYFGMVEMSASQQYWANIFVSDFIEQDLTGFDTEQATLLEMADFAHMFCKINRRSAIGYEGGYETVSLADTNALTQRFFNRTLAPADGVLYTNEWGMEWKYQNGKFYFPAADGEAYNRFAVVSEYQNLPDGSVTLRFDVYELGLEEYFNTGMDSRLYHMTADQARMEEAVGRIVRLGGGTAKAWPYETNSGDEGFYLIHLSTDLG